MPTRAEQLAVFFAGAVVRWVQRIERGLLGADPLVEHAGDDLRVAREARQIEFSDARLPAGFEALAIG